MTGIRSQLKKTATNLKIKEKKRPVRPSDSQPDLNQVERNKTPDNPLDISSPMGIASPSPLRFSNNNLHRRSSAQEICDPSQQIEQEEMDNQPKTLDEDRLPNKLIMSTEGDISIP